MRKTEKKRSESVLSYKSLQAFIKEMPTMPKVVTQPIGERVDLVGIVLHPNQWKLWCRAGVFSYTDRQINRAFKGNGILGRVGGVVHIVNRPIPTIKPGGKHV